MEWTKKNSQSGSCCPGRDSKLEFSNHKSKLLPLKSAWWLCLVCGFVSFVAGNWSLVLTDGPPFEFGRFCRDVRLWWKVETSIRGLDRTRDDYTRENFLEPLWSSKLWGVQLKLWGSQFIFKGTCSEFLLWHRLSWLRVFMLFLSLSRQIPRHYFNVGHGRFLAHAFQLIVHPIIRRRLISKLWCQRGRGEEVNMWELDV
jgi:hypothetical protein